uniref:hypothetical protein n=1 Tax=Pedobacter schmidteae TaxID=2201271 RepID=UPI000EB2E362|nr:hypothetical protein [Pedobacter schmidteae]
MNKNKMEENDFVSIWLEESGNPAIEELTRANHEIADKMAKLLSEKGLNSADLSTIVDINHHEISSWLNGMHTFSRKKLSEISQAMAVYE